MKTQSKKTKNKLQEPNTTAAKKYLKLDDFEVKELKYRVSIFDIKITSLMQELKQKNKNYKPYLTAILDSEKKWKEIHHILKIYIKNEKRKSFRKIIIEEGMFAAKSSIYSFIKMMIASFKNLDNFNYAKFMIKPRLSKTDLAKKLKKAKA